MRKKLLAQRLFIIQPEKLQQLIILQNLLFSYIPWKDFRVLFKKYFYEDKTDKTYPWNPNEEALNCQLPFSAGCGCRRTPVPEIRQISSPLWVAATRADSQGKILPGA